MTRRFSTATLVAALAGSLLSAAGAGTQPSAHFNPATMMRTSEVRLGMKGIGKTVFQGVTISDFDIEVLGVVPKFNAGDDVVLVRVTTGPLCTRECGVVGGMSGSPVYVGGKLIGAVAFTWPFEKEPVAGVTPIESMLKGYVETEAKPAEKSARAPSSPLVLHGRTLTAARIAAVGETRPFADEHTINLVPVGALTCSGYSREALANLGELTAPYGMEPIQGPGTMDKPVKADLVPGAAVSVELQRGDFSVSLIGTVTYRDGDKLLCFGHPFMQLGPVDLPVATAYIHEFIPSYQRTDKIGSAMELVGSLKEDGAWSVGGVVGPVAKMVPVDVAVTDEGTGRRHQYHVEVARQKSITQALIAMSVSNAIEAGFRPAGEGTARVSYEVEGERGAKVKRDNIHWDSGSIAAACTRELASTIYVLRRNPFEPQEPSRVRMELSLSGENRAAAVEEVYTDQTVAKAGEKVTVHVILRPWNGKPFEKVVELPLPEDLERGNLRIGICGGEAAYNMRGRLGLVQPDFHDLPSIIADMEKTELNNQLFVAAALPNTTLGEAQYILHRLPSSIIGMMGDSQSTDVTTGKEEVAKLVDCDQVVLGQEMLTMDTEDRTGARGGGGAGAARKPAPKPTPTPPRPEEPMAALAARVRPTAAHPLNPVTAPPLAWAEQILARCWPAAAASGDASSDPSGDTGKGAPAEKPGAKEGEPTTETPEEPKEEKEEKQEDKGPLARELSEWRQSTKDDFQAGKAEGIAIRSDGTLFVADQKTQAVDTEQRRSVWAVAAAPEGPVYVGLGKDGRIYRLGDDQKLDLLAQTGELSVHALAVNGGLLYAGTIPHGKLYKIDLSKPDSVQLLAALPESYIWALLPDGKDGLFVGTGSAGKLYHVSAQGEVKLLADLPAQHVLCLARLGDDLLAGTAENGVVFRVKPSGQFESIYQDDDGAVTGVAVTASGEAYACTSDSGHIVRLTPGKERTIVLDLKDKAATSMVALGDMIYVGTSDDGKLLAILGPDRIAVIGKVEASDVSCLAAAGKRVVVGSANPGHVEVLDTAARAEGSFVSAVLDAERPARWGMLRWWGEAPGGASTEVRVRVGATDDPNDGTWGPWSYAYPPDMPTKVDWPPARFAQYRVEMKKADGGASPVFSALLLKYLPANQPPTTKLTAPLEGAAISGQYEIKWDASDPDGDDLRYAVYARRAGSKDWKLLADQLEEKTYKWDTKKGKDPGEGAVEVRVVASDAVASPQEPLSKETIAHSVLIDNTPPTVSREGEPQVAEDRTVTLTGTAADSASAIVSVEYQIGSKAKWLTARPVNGLFDSQVEGFVIHTDALDPREHVITIRARDAAGNKQDLNVTVVVPGDKKAGTGGAATKPGAPAKDKPKKKHGG